jgi:glutathione S-transferase
MITLYHAPRTRSVRILWLFEELGLPYELKKVEFVRPSTTFSQRTPLGKLPVIEDGEVTICESGAILEYILERYGRGRLAPAVGSPLRGPFLQWLHFAEGTAYPPLGVIVWHTLYKGDADGLPSVIEDARDRARTALDFLEQALAENAYLLGDDFSGADIMVGFTLAVARALNVLDDRYSQLAAYLARLEERSAFQRALAA